MSEVDVSESVFPTSDGNASKCVCTWTPVAKVHFWFNRLGLKIKGGRIKTSE